MYLKSWIKNEINDFLSNIISLFEELKEGHTSTVLDCILTLGKEVIDTKDQYIISFFIRGLIALGLSLLESLKSIMIGSLPLTLTM